MDCEVPGQFGISLLIEFTILDSIEFKNLGTVSPELSHKSKNDLLRGNLIHKQEARLEDTMQIGGCCRKSPHSE
jgi:hypothetical protein